MNKIRMTENQLHKVIRESVKKILKESDNKLWIEGMDNELQALSQKIQQIKGVLQGKYSSGNITERLGEAYNMIDSACEYISNISNKWLHNNDNLK